jgi:ribosomal-protein-alanine N-acetyltransferase
MILIPTFENQIVRLREPRITDAIELLNITNDFDVMQYYGMEPYKTSTEAEEEIKWFQSLFNDNKGGRWVITNKATDEYIGDVGLFNYIQKHNRVEIGFKLKKEFWGKGIMSFSIQCILKYGFITKNYNRIEAVVDKNNMNCIKTLKRNGFMQEGLLREYESENGKYVDLYMFSILKDEY